MAQNQAMNRRSNDTFSQTQHKTKTQLITLFRSSVSCIPHSSSFMDIIPFKQKYSALCKNLYEKRSLRKH